MQMGQILGIYERIDWDFTIPRNICFMRIRVRMDPRMPLIAGFMLCLNNGDRVWIQCRYERVHNVCTKCGLIRHTRAQCTYIMADVEHLLNTQWQRIQRDFHGQYGFDPLEPHFVNKICAFYNKPSKEILRYALVLWLMIRDIGIDNFSKVEHPHSNLIPTPPQFFLLMTT